MRNSIDSTYPVLQLLPSQTGDIAFLPPRLIRQSDNKFVLFRTTDYWKTTSIPSTAFAKAHFERKVPCLWDGRCLRGGRSLRGRWRLRGGRRLRGRRRLLIYFFGSTHYFKSWRTHIKKKKKKPALSGKFGISGNTRPIFHHDLHHTMSSFWSSLFLILTL